MQRGNFPVTDKTLVERRVKIFIAPNFRFCIFAELYHSAVLKQNQLLSAALELKSLPTPLSTTVKNFTKVNRLIKGALVVAKFVHPQILTRPGQAF